MNDKIKEALKQFNREDLIDDGYEHNDLDTGITVSLTIKQMIYYNQLQSNWNSLRELIEQRIYLIEPKGTCINFYCEYDSEDDYVQGMKDQARLNTLKSILDKMNELEGGEDNEG